MAELQDKPVDGADSTMSRRRLLAGGALAVGGATLVGAGGLAASRHRAQEPAAAALPDGKATIAFYGQHQSGVETPPQSNAVFIAFDLADGTDRDAVIRMMKILTDDAARLTSGTPALADTEPELALLPSRLTVTFGFGAGLFRAAGVDDRRPGSIAPLPSFPIDKLEDRWSGGDLLVQICADDPLIVSHAQRMIIKDARAFGRVRWVQQGFRNNPGTQSSDLSQRNLMGQVDGTVNPAPGTDVFRDAVWIDDGPQWLRGGTTMVVRRIRMEMETWDIVDREGREFIIGRRLDNGAPLTGHAERDEPDYQALTPVGFPVISDHAHIRRAHVVDERMRILRRPYNFDTAVAADGTPDCGLLFVSFQADVIRQFLPIQQRLAESDLLNEWTTPVGSAVFAIPPGCAPGEYIGQTLLD